MEVKLLFDRCIQSLETGRVQQYTTLHQEAAPAAKTNSHKKKQDS
jgi:hypothetical protein